MSKKSDNDDDDDVSDVSENIVENIHSKIRCK